MKTKTILFLTSLMFSLTVAAQEHLMFKGIPITGSLSSFCEKLSAKGYRKVSATNQIALFKGDFTNRKADVAVGSTNDGQHVYSVVVVFESSDEWNTLLNTYRYYKDLYTRKYGEISKQEEYHPVSSGSNVSYMNCLAQGQVTFVSVWQVTGGYIELSIEKAAKYGEGVVAIKYRDNQNIEAKIQKDLEEI